MPGGFGKDHPLPGETPCNCPSLGNALPFLFLPSKLQLDKDIITTAATKMNELYFIVLTFGRISKCNDYFELQNYTKT